MKPEDVIADRTRPYHRRGIHAVPARRPRSLYRRRTRRGRHHPPRAAQLGPVHRAALRRAARPEAPRRADLPHRHRLRRLHASLLPRAALARGPARRAGRDRRVVAHDLWLDGPHARLQGGLLQHARRQRGVLRPVRRQRPRLVQARAGNRAVHEPRHRQSADRPPQAGRAGEGRLRLGAEGDRRRHHRLRRQGGGDFGGDHPLQLHGPELEDRDRGPGHVADVHGADRRAGTEADLPHVVREGGAAERFAVRLPAVVAVRRERRDLHPRQRVRALGGRVHLSRSRARAELLSRAPASCTASSSRAARASR